MGESFKLHFFLFHLLTDQNSGFRTKHIYQLTADDGITNKILCQQISKQKQEDRLQTHKLKTSVHIQTSEDVSVGFLEALDANDRAEQCVMVFAPFFSKR